MEAGAPDEPFIPRTDVDPDSVETHAHEFAEAAIHEDTLAAVVELTKLPPEERGEVVRRGLAELRERQEHDESLGNAERLLHRQRLRCRRLGRRAIAG